MKASVISLLRKCRRETSNLQNNIFSRPSSSNSPPPSARLNDYCYGGQTRLKGPGLFEVKILPRVIVEEAFAVEL